VSTPITTRAQADAWANENGITIDIEIRREATRWPYSWPLAGAGDVGFIAFVEAVRRFIETHEPAKGGA
jgi:hypothetical protein